MHRQEAKLLGPRRRRSETNAKHLAFLAEIECRKSVRNCVCVEVTTSSESKKKNEEKTHKIWIHIVWVSFHVLEKRRDEKKRNYPRFNTHLTILTPCVGAFRFFLFRSLSHPCHRVVVLICACVCVNPSCLTFFFSSPLCLLWFGHFGHCRMDPHILNRTFYSSSPRKKKSDLKMFTNDVQKGKKEARRPTSA